MENELHDLRIGYASLLQSCYSYKLDGSMGNGQNLDLRISSKVRMTRDQVFHFEVETTLIKWYFARSHFISTTMGEIILSL